MILGAATGLDQGPVTDDHPLPEKEEWRLCYIGGVMLHIGGLKMELAYQPKSHSSYSQKLNYLFVRFETGLT